VNDTDTQRPRQFLTDLVKAMGEAARTAQQATIEQCQSDAQAYTEHLRAGTNGGTGALHKAAVADVATIREQSKEAVDRVRVETEERISRRNKKLEHDLHQYEAAVEYEITRVGEETEGFKAEVARFFEQLMQGDDPMSLVAVAARMPQPPAFDDPNPKTLLREFHRVHGQASFSPRANAKPRSGQPD
jgi:hypothetical protein